MDFTPPTKLVKTTVLATVSGLDSPGITSEMTRILSQYQVNILDISQAVIHGLLSLSFVFEIMSDPDQKSSNSPGHSNLPSSTDAIIKELLFKTNELNLKLAFRKLEPESIELTAPVQKISHYAVTLIAECVTPRALHEVTRALAAWNINIDIIKRLSEGQFSCVEMMVSSPLNINERALRKQLLVIAKEQQVDIALQAEGLYRRAKRLVVLDMDSTLIQSEVIDELAREKGAYDEVAAITHQAMSGKLNFDESLVRRCQFLKGLTLEDLERVYQGIQITPGAQDMIHVLKKLGYKIAVISGGFSFVANRLKERLGIDFAYSNHLEVQDGHVTGKVTLPIINAQRKADLLSIIADQEKIDLDQVIAIGDGANDLPMLEKAGLGIAFNAKPIVSEQADLAYSQKNMRSILYLLGLSARDVSEVVTWT